MSSFEEGWSCNVEFAPYVLSEKGINAPTEYNSQYIAGKVKALCRGVFLPNSNCSPGR
jgi:hypothetical protein